MRRKRLKVGDLDAVGRLFADERHLGLPRSTRCEPKSADGLCVRFEDPSGFSYEVRARGCARSPSEHAVAEHGDLLGNAICGDAEIDATETANRLLADCGCKVEVRLRTPAKKVKDACALRPIRRRSR